MALQNKTLSIKTRISLKLFCTSVLSILIFTIPLFFLVNHALKNLGRFADTANTRQIKQIASQFLTSMAREKARKYDEIFLHGQTSVTFLGIKASEIYSQLNAGNPSHSPPPPMTLNPDSNIFYTPESEPLITAFWGETTISPAIASELKALTEIDPYLAMIRKNIPWAAAVHITTRSGIGKFHTLNPDMRQARFNLPNSVVFDLRDGEPMTTFTRQLEPDFTFRWTRLYKNDMDAGLIITGVAPILDDDRRFKGIVGMDIPLNHLIQDLDAGHPVFSDPEEHRGDYFAFLMDAHGRLISFPFTHLSLFGLDKDIRHFKNSSDILPLNLSDSRLPVVAETAQHILESMGHQDTLTINDQSYVLASHRLQQTGWYIGLVSSENGLLHSIRQTREVMENNLSGILKSFMIYAGIIFLVALGCNYLGVRRFIRPLRQLTLLTRQISREGYSEKAPENRNDEIGELSRAFNEMTHRLQLSQQREKEHIQVLSRQAARLKELNEHLVYSDETERKTIASDLHDSVVQTLAMGISRTKT